MPYEVLLTAEAARDLEEISGWISQNDSPERAAEVVHRIETAMTALEKFPSRGAHPAELLVLGIREYRETSFKPYRIVYRVEGKRVYVEMIADGRRDMQTLLARRLLEG